MFPQTNPLMVDDCWFVLLFPLGSTGVLWETWPSHENSWRFRENRSWWIFQKATVGDNGGEMNKGRESRNISENAVWRCEMIWKNKNRVKEKKQRNWLVGVGWCVYDPMYVCRFLLHARFRQTVCWCFVQALPRSRHVISSFHCPNMSIYVNISQQNHTNEYMTWLKSINQPY